MKNKFIFPDFSRSNMNISSTLSEFLGVKTDKPTLKILKEGQEKFLNFYNSLPENQRKNYNKQRIS